MRKATRRGAQARAPPRPGVVKDPGTLARSLRGNREISRLASRNTNWSASGRRGVIADDQRTGEVRLRHIVGWAARSSGEVEVPLALEGGVPYPAGISALTLFASVYMHDIFHSAPIRRDGGKPKATSSFCGTRTMMTWSASSTRPACGAFGSRCE